MAVALKGFETFAGTNTPVVGATVDAIAASDTHPNGGATVASTTTNANGMWAFAALADGVYDIRILYNSRYRWRKGNEAFSNALTGANFGNQTANRLLAGPTSGGAATPTFRVLVAADYPANTVPIASLADAGAGNLIVAGPSGGGAGANSQRAQVVSDTPLQALIPGFFAFNSAAFSVTNGSVQQVLYDTEDYDNLGNFNLGTDVFIAPRAGVYMIGFGHVWDATIAITKRIIGTLSVNGTIVRNLYDFTTSAASTNWAWGGSFPVKLAASDSVAVGAFNGDTTARSILGGRANNWFSAHWLPGS